MSLVEGLEGFLNRVDRPLSWQMLLIGVVGSLVSVPVWALNVVGDWAMIGVTLVLSFAALWYAAFLAIQEQRHAKEVLGLLRELRALQVESSQRVSSIQGRLEASEKRQDAILRGLATRRRSSRATRAEKG